MDWMYAACSTTARRGAIDWAPKFKDTLKPIFNQLYESVKLGHETKRALAYNSHPKYRENLEAELKEIRNMEIWRAGKAVRHVPQVTIPVRLVTYSLFCYRSLRPENS
jgi:ketol-acid reductoisomerase